MTPHAKPLSPKDSSIVKSGYAESDFSEDYWIVPDVNGDRRINRSANALITLVEKLISRELIPKDPMIVDVGAGPGMIVDQFRRAGYAAEGCEFSESGRRIANHVFGIDLLPCDLRSRLPYNTGSFDFAMCVGVLTMVPVDDMPNAMWELCRILSFRGVLLVNLMNPKPVENEPHLTALPPLEWRSLLIGAGFEDVTSVWPPQREGIGMLDEFCGLFRKVA